LKLLWLRLEFNQTPPASGVQVNAHIPSDPLEAPAGDNLLFVFVDDIPSVGRIVAITRDVLYRPTVQR